jgi:hypothetical protein
MLRFCLVIQLLLGCYVGESQINISPAVQKVIAKSAKNQQELKKAMNWYKPKSADSLKFKAMSFLIENMDIHYSVNYYWADSTGKKVTFDELKYESFITSIHAFDSLKQQYGKLHPVPVRYYDIDTITSNYLVNNIEQAFKVWLSPIAKNISFEDFCEYILPYRISIEPLQDWRGQYEKRFAWLYDSVRNFQPTNMISFLIKDINKWFTCIYELEKRNEPLPRLGSLQVLQRKKGYCEDVADLSVFALRSQGICASTDLIPYWATSSGTHMLNSAKDNTNQSVHFDVLFKDGNMKQLIREPGKVFRQTFSKQKNALPAIIDTSKIPLGVLRNHNIIDVTKEYWKTDSFSVALRGIPNDSLKTVYACVLNYQNWQPIWWSRKIEKGRVQFTDMCKGVVYLPMYHIKNKLGPAGYPVALGYNHTVVLKPDTTAKRTITIEEQEQYLKLQTGKKYKLFYWDGKWRQLGIQTAVENIKTLAFENVPSNALLMLIPEYSKRKERPFIITEENRRVWF